MASAKTRPLVLSHWAQLLEGVQASPLSFFESVEHAVERRALPDTERLRVDWHEGGILSAKREYLRIQSNRLAFDICGAPYGNGFFVSWWLGRLPSPYGPLALAGIALAVLLLGAILTKLFGAFFGIVLMVFSAPVLLYLFARYLADQVAGWDDALAAMPAFGWLYQRWFSPETYYRLDTAAMFRSAVHAAVLEVVDELVKDGGLAPLSELERKPVLRELFHK
ncbi:MAG: hypothetical protein ACE5GJ_14945 [Gemmatimonadota bacterium]